MCSLFFLKRLLDGIKNKTKNYNLHMYLYISIAVELEKYILLIYFYTEKILIKKKSRLKRRIETLMFRESTDSCTPYIAINARILIPPLI